MRNASHLTRSILLVVAGLPSAGCFYTSAEPVRHVEYVYRCERPASVRVTAPPPPVRAEVPPPPTVQGRQLWIGGYWDWQGNDWQWRPGRYEERRPGMAWVPPRYDSGSFNPGYWGPSNERPVRQTPPTVVVPRPVRPDPAPPIAVSPVRPGVTIDPGRPVRPGPPPFVVQPDRPGPVVVDPGRPGRPGPVVVDPGHPGHPVHPGRPGPVVVEPGRPGRPGVPPVQIDPVRPGRPGPVAVGPGTQPGRRPPDVDVRPIAPGLEGRVRPGEEGRVRPVSPGIDGRVRPIAPGVEGRVRPPITGEPGVRPTPIAPGVDGRVRPSLRPVAPGIDGRIRPGAPVAPGVEGRIRPTPSAPGGGVRERPSQVGSARCGGASPSSGVVGSNFTVSGEGFGNDRGRVSVTVGNIGAAIRRLSDRAITVEVPPGTEGGGVTVRVDGIPTSCGSFSVLAGRRPRDAHFPGRSH